MNRIAAKPSVKYFNVIMPVAIMIMGIVGLSLFSSCRASVPVKEPPAYTIAVSFQSQPGVVTVAQGGSASLPVTVTSLVDQPLNIRLVLMSSVGQLPKFLQYDAPIEFVTLTPNASFNTQITFGVSNDAPLGDYNVGVTGQLQQPVKERSSLTEMFRLTVTAIPVISFPPTTVRDVPDPAPVPWPDVLTYTEQTYHIEAKVGEEFAIGMFATAAQNFSESHDQNFLDKVEEKMVEYQPIMLNKFGTDWFLFKSLKTGDTELVFRYPIEYTKLFAISIK